MNKELRNTSKVHSPGTQGTKRLRLNHRIRGCYPFPHALPSPQQGSKIMRVDYNWQNCKTWTLFKNEFLGTLDSNVNPHKKLKSIGKGNNIGKYKK